MYVVSPFGQSQVLPQPSDIPPRLPSLGQVGLQQLPPYTTDPLGQPQVLPQPSDIPPRLPSVGQFGVQQPAIDIMLPVGQPHLPLQPSSMPARLPSAGHVGVQMHVPCAQRPLVPHALPPQSHVSMQVPLLQTLPAKHVTPAHGLVMHLPALQLWPLGHATPAHGSAAAQVSTHTLPVPQFALHVFCVVHFPLSRSHTCPEGQVTPAHGCRKQPEMHTPLTQVWLLAQVTPAHGSPVGTQVGLQVAPPPQALAPTHGSG